MANIVALTPFVLLLSTAVTLTACSYGTIIKQFDVQALPEDDKDVVTLRTDFDDGSECVYPTDCYDVKECGRTKSGVYRVFPLAIGDGFLVYCDMETAAGGWLVFQRRQDGSVDFYRNWKNYTHGFGNLLGEFWLGLEKIHLLTTQRRYELLVDLGSYDNGTRYAKYNRFYISDEIQGFQLLLGSFTGTAGDSMSYHNGFKFSTFDKENDHHAILNCAKKYSGAWWYKSCHYSNLNGEYFPVIQKTTLESRSANWYHWSNSRKPLQFVEMKLRPLV